MPDRAGLVHQRKEVRIMLYLPSEQGQGIVEYAFDSWSWSQSL